MAPIMAEHTEQRRRPRTGVYPGTFDPIHNRHLDIIRRATLSDVAEDEHVVAVVCLVGAAEPNEPEPSGPGPDESGGGGDPNEPEPFRLNEPGGGDPNEPEPNGRGPNEPELNRRGPNEPEPYRLNEPGGGDPNEPESYDGIGPTPDGADHG
jgi:hypothetical protein